MNVSCFVLQMLSGATAGNLLAGAFRRLHLGVVGNSLTGILGGGLGGQIFFQLSGVELQYHASDAAIFLMSVFGGGSGGAFVTAIAGLIKEIGNRKF